MYVFSSHLEGERIKKTTIRVKKGFANPGMGMEKCLALPRFCFKKTLSITVSCNEWN